MHGGCGVDTTKTVMSRGLNDDGDDSDDSDVTVMTDSDVTVMTDSDVTVMTAHVMTRCQR